MQDGTYVATNRVIEDGAIRTYLEKQIRWIIKMVKNEQRYNNHKVSVQ